jgi:hypothetical protein
MLSQQQLEAVCDHISEISESIPSLQRDHPNPQQRVEAPGRLH